MTGVGDKVFNTLCKYYVFLILYVVAADGTGCVHRAAGYRFWLVEGLVLEDDGRLALHQAVMDGAGGQPHDDVGLHPCEHGKTGRDAHAGSFWR